ncbi:MAG: DUF4251 domain-containing protein [Alistipes sp.]
MKRSLLSLSLLLFSLMSVLSAEAKKPVTDPRQAAIVEKLLNSRDYRIAVTSVYPLKQRSFTVIGYTIHVCGDTLQTVLPYVGQSYRAPLGADEGMSFNDAPITNYRVKKMKRGNWVITFSARTSTESCSFTFRIEPNGLTSVSLFQAARHRIQRRSICPKHSGFLIERTFRGACIIFVARRRVMPSVWSCVSRFVCLSVSESFRFPIICFAVRVLEFSVFPSEILRRRRLIRQCPVDEAPRQGI